MTFLFTDIEGSTKLLKRLGNDYPAALELHREIIREAMTAAGGREIDTQGDAFFYVFRTASQAVHGASAAQLCLAGHPWPQGNEVRVRMGLHTGEATISATGFVGIDVHRAARVAAAAHGGQVLLTDATRAILQDKLPETMELKDLGHHGLKDLPSPEHLFQLVVPELASSFPPVRSFRARRNNLPADMTRFVGRQRDVAEVYRLLDDTRLLTLSGPGGTGKSRLAVEAARGLLDAYADGVYLVSLAAVQDPALISATVADTIGVAVTDRPATDVLEEHLEHRCMLLILDNFEHLVAGAEIVAKLLHAAPGLKVMVTSRAPLRLSGEQELPVPPMELPEPGVPIRPEDCSCCDALALFVQRARATDPAFTVDGDNAAVIADICFVLDGLPLAIELAAARLNVLTPHLLREGLRSGHALLRPGPTDSCDRQRTLDSAIAWSHDLLGPEDRVLFRRLSVFSEGCTLSAVQAVMDEDLAGVLDRICSLVENSLLRRTVELGHEPRFRMLGTIRDFARRCLVESGEIEDMERWHARYYLEVAEDAESHLTGESTSGVDTGVQAEQSNLREAMRWCLRVGDTETGLRIASALWRFWQQQGQLEEGRRWMARLLAMAGAAERSAWRAKALCATGGMAYWQGDYEEAATNYAEGLALWRELGDRRGTSEVLRSLGYLAAIKGDYDRAHALHGESRAIAVELNDPCSVGYGLVADGMIHHLEGEIETAVASFNEASDLFRQVGERYGLAAAQCLLSRILVEQAEPEAAQALWSRAFRLIRELRDGSGMIIALSDLAAIELVRGRAEAAVRLAGAADGLSQALNLCPPAALTKPPDPRAVARREIGSEAVESAWEGGRAMTLAEAIAYALDETGMDEDAPLRTTPLPGA